MTQSRFPDKTTHKKLIHNLEQVADELIVYVQDLQSVRELVQHVDAADKQYHNFWNPLYYLTRLRGPEVSVLINSLNQSNSALTLLEAIDQFFSNGGWTTTSINKHLIIELVLGLPGYTDTRAKFSLNYDHLLELRDLFLKRTAKILYPVASELSPEENQQERLRKQQIALEQQLELKKKMEMESQRIESERLYNFDLQRKVEQERELQLLPRRNIRHEAEKLAETDHFLLKRQDVNKLDDEKYGKLKAKLTGHYQNILLRTGYIKPEDVKTQPVVEGVTMKNKVGKLNPDRINQLDAKLGRMLEAAAKDFIETRAMENAMENAAPAQLCRAAFEAPVVTAPVTGEAREMVFNSEQTAAMLRLFGSAQKGKFKTPAKDETPDHTPSPVA